MLVSQGLEDEVEEAEELSSSLTRRMLLEGEESPVLLKLPEDKEAEMQHSLVLRTLLEEEGEEQEHALVLWILPKVAVVVMGLYVQLSLVLRVQLTVAPAVVLAHFSLVPRMRRKAGKTAYQASLLPN